MRFAAATPRLEPKVLDALCAIDGDRHVAWGALDGRRLTAMGRYVRFSRDSGTADVSITVADSWQGRGLGTEMLTLLARTAADRGIERLSFTVLGDNRAAQRLLRRFAVRLRFSAGLGEAVAPVLDLLVSRSGSRPQPLSSAA
jgi:RimJ/RimL family protein N-acetyltransferase